MEGQEFLDVNQVLQQAVLHKIAPKIIDHMAGLRRVVHERGKM
jgi:hypothetical protein